jgi:hypothetical protein
MGIIYKGGSNMISIVIAVICFLVAVYYYDKCNQLQSRLNRSEDYIQYLSGVIRNQSKNLQRRSTHDYISNVPTTHRH